MHNPVMLNEVLKYLAPKDGEVFVDATLGAGNYSLGILNCADCSVIGIDQDPLAESLAGEIKGKFKFIKGNFGDLANLLTEKVDGIVFDIGVSSMQFDTPRRGFSFQRDGALDMRMSQSGETAAEFLNSADEKIIADVIFKYGEEKSSRRIAKFIVGARPLSTTSELREIVHKAIGNFGKTDSATRTFQAIRIYINDELANLERGLAAALKLLKTGGRLVVVTFHSLEDRIVKTFFKTNSGEKETGNRHQFFGDFETAKKNSITPEFALEIITKKAIVPGSDEIASNPRARSAKLRAAKITNREV